MAPANKECSQISVPVPLLPRNTGLRSRLPEVRPPGDPGVVFFLGPGLLEVSGHAACLAGSR